MSLNNPRIEIATAYPNLQEISVGKGKGVTLFGDIHTDQGAKRAFVKLLSLEGIAREAICSVVGRMLHLPLRQGYYVNVANTQFHRQVGNLEHLAFGTLDDATRLFPLKELSSVETDLLKWDDVLKSAVFDEWIANGDRLPNNMVFERGGVFWLFDHDEAFPGHVSAATPVSPQLLALLARGKSEFDLYRIRQQAVDIIEAYKKIDWHEVYDDVRIKEEGKCMKPYFDKHIHFLKARIPEM
ncbi:HipA family kinase [Cellvibrio japonicus]|uniref:HipA-like kinase domain-containing protein n=1 Tax=Cellvibrio japonicus (strain Ueda107) TaxID=498211 RepID=B3PHY9_CELJU|nr:HipA family kinase [Cellvibrio japonicus]ACE85854.1 hypothetical protein CJA_3733 [Cellvibrio japonicus Ueda107]QEI13926.1 hypothetical protein FY117_18010 [Cellvibrio japonicus]QEI17500.1 hypothetical protein FY116_18015 [Cellvibrio japonicus]QEI21076.1 hypothetical protein FY115_18010 [Cellvibrio japonicus]